MNVTIFGGASPIPGAAAYRQAERLGELLARQGDAILTGGYIGTMEAASRGAANAGGHVIGVTCDEIENWRDIKPNAWVAEERRHAKLSERLQALLLDCDAAIALPGGVGTLAEIAMLWNHLIIEARPPCRLVLVGEGWKTFFTAFIRDQQIYLTQSMIDLVSCVDTVEEAVDVLHPTPKDQVNKP